MQLSAQSIYDLCTETKVYDIGHRVRLIDPRTGDPLPMISPFVAQRTVVNGKSYGLSSASYDIRIGHDLVLGPHPGYLTAEGLEESRAYPASHALHHTTGKLKGMPPAFALAHTLEDFAIPKNIAAYVCDKSTYARQGVSCFNTLFDPGFIGNGTLELVNLSAKVIVIRAGDPICQLVFHMLDEATDRPYEGKYQYQPREAVGPILEGTIEAA